MKGLMSCPKDEETKVRYQFITLVHLLQLVHLINLFIYLFI